MICGLDVSGGKSQPHRYLLGGRVLRLLSLSYILAVSRLPGVQGNWWVEVTLAQSVPVLRRVPPVSISQVARAWKGPAQPRITSRDRLQARLLFPLGTEDEGVTAAAVIS